MKTLKETLKKILVIWMVICALLPSLFTGVVLAAENEAETINQERAGNYVANFAINFYENWSSLTPVEGTGSFGTGRGSNTKYMFPIKDNEIGESRGFGGEDNHIGYDIHTYERNGEVQIYSVCSGTVVSAGFDDSMGNYVTVEMEDGGYKFHIRYMHMYTTPLVKEGDKVESGTLLGLVGTTGNSTGPHLHIDFSVGSKEIADELKDKLGDYIGPSYGRYYFDALNFIPSVDDFFVKGADSDGNVTGVKGNVLAAAQYIWDNNLLGKTNISYNDGVGGRESKKIVYDEAYLQQNGIDCSTYVSAALWLAGYTQFANASNTWQMEAACNDGTYAKEYGFGVYKTDGKSVFKYNTTTDEYEIMEGQDPVAFLQPGDVIVITRGDNTNGHTNIVKAVTPNKTHKYISLDAGSQYRWWNVENYNSCGGGIERDIWTPILWASFDDGYHGAYQAYLIRASESNAVSSSSSGTPVQIRGEIKTEYDEEVNPLENVDPETEGNYKFNNLSWISFAYRNSLFKGNVDNILTGSGSSLDFNSDTFDKMTKREEFNNTAPKTEENTTDEAFLPITTLMSEGKILPGDILYVEDGQGGSEYLLYVGGAKVIYATADKTASPSGALKYEYMQYYLKRMKDKYTRETNSESNEQESKSSEEEKIPAYGVSAVYRIKPDVANAIKETDTNLFFNGKGYYSNVSYSGLPSTGTFSEYKMKNPFKWIFDMLAQLLEFLLNLVLYMVRMQVVGFVNLFENLIQHVVLGLSNSNNDASIWEGFFGTSATSASGERITIESIIFNKIPILDENFFDAETAGGRSLTKEVPAEESSQGSNTNSVQTQEHEMGPVYENINETNTNDENTFIGPLQLGESRLEKSNTTTKEETVTVPDENNVVYTLRRAVRYMYSIIRNLSIALMLFLLVVIGIKIAISTSADKKAEYKKWLTTWVIAMIVVLFVHLYMYVIISANQILVKMCENLGQDLARETVSEVVENSNSQGEVNLYDAIRIKAYAFNWREGIPGTILYIFMVYLMVRFLLIYFKRVFTIIVQVLEGSFIGVKYAIDKLFGKKTTSLKKWAKSFAGNVFLRFIHAFTYTIFIGLALQLAEISFGGVLLALIVLHTMLTVDKMVIQMFGLDKDGILSDVNNAESWSSVVNRFAPAYIVTKSTFGFAKDSLFGKYGLFGENGTFNAIRYMRTGAKTRKEAKKIVDMKKFERKGKFARSKFMGAINRTPLKKLFKYNEYKKLMGNGESYETNKKIMQSIKNAKKMNRAKFTRKVSLAKDFGLSAFGKVAAIGVAIANPIEGFNLYNKSSRRIKKYASNNQMRLSGKKYKGSRIGARTRRAADAKNSYNDATNYYNMALNIYTENEFNFKEAYNRLLDDFDAAAVGSKERDDIKEQIRILLEQREKERSEEMHILQDAKEKMDEKSIIYQNAKHEITQNRFTEALEKVTGIDTIAKVAENDRRASYKAKEDASKAKSKLDNVANAAKVEQEVRKITKEIKDKINSYIETEATNNGWTDEQKERKFNELYDAEIASVLKSAKDANVSTNYINQAINDVLAGKQPASAPGGMSPGDKIIHDGRENLVSERITAKDVDNVLDNIQDILKRNGKKLNITDDMKTKVKEQLEQKMIKDKKGYGYDAKEATAVIREILGRPGVIEPTRKARIDDSKISNFSQLHNDLINALGKVNTYNAVGKWKNKDTAVDVNKIMKSAKKQ